LNNGVGRGFRYGPGFGQPDAGLLDPDAADGYQEQRRRTPNRQFFTPALPPFQDLYQQHDADGPGPGPGHGHGSDHEHGAGHVGGGY
jgi:hypothetical protein